MEITPGFSYDEYMAILERDNGWVPVCVPLIDTDGVPAILTTSYSMKGLNSLEDWESVDTRTMHTALILMMQRSRATIIQHGGVPLENARP